MCGRRPRDPGRGEDAGVNQGRVQDTNVRHGILPFMTATTHLSSRGQVVIPARVRRALGWRPGEKLSVEVGPAGARALVLRGRSSDEMEAALARGYDWFERSRRDLVEALHATRRRARARERRRR